MINIKLPDNSIRSFPSPITIFDVAKDISQSLAKIAIAGTVDGIVRDLSYVIKDDCSLTLITDKDDAGLEIIRHSTAHLLAQAVKQLFPSVQVTIGPVIDNGFYYDFSYEHTFTPDDLVKIEKKMEDLVKQNIPLVRQEMTRDNAIKYFASIGEKYKVEIIKGIPGEEAISLYTQGEFTDLCRGAHVPSTGKLRAFKLTKLAGAYWRGDSKNEMLQRIYGTAWRTKEELQQHLTFLEEAEKRDHRKIAKQLDLFHLQEEAPGMVFWHHKGFAIWRIVEEYIRQEYKRSGYKEIKTPQVVDQSLWEKSGHLANYAENMFLTSSENRNYALKPMSCPCHVLVFNQGLKSYRDLPLRLSEFGACHRNEASGALHGLMRVRGFVQDDAHIFCTHEQIKSETKQIIALVFKIYKRFGFDDLEIRLSTRPEKFVGELSLWNQAEKVLEESLVESGLKYVIQAGDGAFYGPKIDFALKDCLNREWQCGTLQLDFNMPNRLGASYIGSDGNKQVPVMLHRAVLGSIERFIGVLLEHYAGDLPLWLAPIQMAVLNISEKQSLYAIKVQEQLVANGFRCEIDLSNEKISYKIRENTLQKIPYLLIIGDKEVEAETITVRKRNGEDLGKFSLSDFIILLQAELV